MATFTTYLQGDTDTEVGASDVLQFAGGSFDDPISVGSYNSSMHVKNSGGTEDSSGNNPNNVAYVSSNQGDWGDGTESLSSITNSECTELIEFSHGSAVETSSAEFYFWGASHNAAPSDVTLYASEQGDSDWSQAVTGSSALGLGDQGSTTTHNFYIAVSASPDSVGEKSFNQRVELTYS
jgi:hypothetical protein